MSLNYGECLKDSFENCSDSIARHNLELDAPTNLDESVGLAQCCFRIAAENLGMQKNYNASHHRQQKAERRRSGAFCCPSACDCYAFISMPSTDLKNSC